MGKTISTEGVVWFEGKGRHDLKGKKVKPSKSDNDM